MKKVLDLLEKHVEWFAIALGVAFLGMMAWYFMITSPVTTTIGSEALTPGKIEEYTYNNPATTIESQMQSGGKIENLPKPEWVKQFKTAMGSGAGAPLAMNRPWIDSAPVPSNIEQPGGEMVGLQPVAALPTVPAALMGGFTTGSSSVVAPGQNTNPVDKTWMAVAFGIPNKEQALAFSAVRLPQAFYKIEVVEVQLYRQQQKQDGSWTEPPVLIARLPFEPLQPIPAANAPRSVQDAFIKWAAENQKPILQPEFYDVRGGDSFTPPAMIQPKVVEKTIAVEGLPNFDPTRWDYTFEEQKQMTPDQRKQFDEAKKRHEAEEREKRKNARPPGGARKGGGGRAGGAHSGDDEDRPLDVPPDDVPNPFAPQTSPHASVVMYWQDPNAQPGAQPGAVPAPPGQPGEAPSTQPANAYPCPTGPYDPKVAPDQWIGWAFDETAEPGKIYRYRIVYSIKNPVFNADPKYVINPAMAKQLAIQSDVAKTNWSEPIKIPSRTSFYISKAISDRQTSVTFEVFAQQGGAKRRHEFSINPGDMIGSPAEGVDFGTGATLVDMAQDRRTQKWFAIIADANGNLTRRDYDSDKNSPDYQNDKSTAQSGSASATPSPSGVASGR